MDEIEVLNGTARVGDRLAVARVEYRSGGMSVGEILEILDGNRVKVRVDIASGFRGQKYNPETGRHEFKPYVKTYDNPRHMVKLPPPSRDARQDYLGQRVKVTLVRADGVDPAVIAEGKLLGFGQGGNFEIEEDDGFVHYCWPMLDIELSENR